MDSSQPIDGQDGIEAARLRRDDDLIGHIRSAYEEHAIANLGKDD
jgi:hypothetical protein